MTDLLTGKLPPVLLADQIACIERELRMRREVYPRRVADNKMRQSSADEEIRRMGAVLQTLLTIQRGSTNG